MVDRPPPSRFSVVERGGRLVVIDKETGQTPPTAAERMDAHDRKLGIEPNRPVIREAPKVVVAAPKPPEPQRRTAAPASRPASEPMAAAVARINDKRPWKEAAKPSMAPERAAAPEPARIAERPTPPARGRKTIVTGQWWDAKGPRTIELGPKGQQALSGGFVTLFVVALMAAVVMLIVQPVLLFISGFLLFRFGGKILGPLGAGIVDKALAERN